MSADGVQSRAVPQFALDIGDERFRGLLRRCEVCCFAENKRIDGDEPPRLLIGGAAHHHAVDPTEMRKRRLDPANAAVKNDSQAGMRTFESIDATQNESRKFAGILC